MRRRSWANTRKHLENLETKGGDREEVDRDQLLGVILQKSAPGPEQAKAGAMPSNDRFRLDDGQRRAPAAPLPG